MKLKTRDLILISMFEALTAIGAFIIGKITEKSKNLNIFKVFISCILELSVIYLELFI